MDSRLSKEINDLALEKVKEFVPDFKKYSLNQSFNALWDSNEIFVQISFQDRTGFREDMLCEVSLLIRPEHLEEFLSIVETYHEKLKEAQDVTMKELIPIWDWSTYL